MKCLLWTGHCYQRYLCMNTVVQKTSPFLPREAMRSAVLPRQVVCPSVHLSVSGTLRYRDHIGWNSWKITSGLISLTISLSADSNMMHLLQTEQPQISRNRTGVGKIVDFRHLSRRISETVQDRVQVAIEH